MKANELRIGSLVYITDTSTLLFYKQVTQINIHNLMYLCGETKEPFEFEIEPIPLTEEWLLKFGFEEYIDFGYKTKNFDLIPLCGFTYSINKKRVMIMHKGNQMSHWLNIEIQYVHQLQNLYFALTNEELI
jgi:hypothetical protein